MNNISKNAFVDPGAELDGVEVGPFTTIGPNVKLGKGTVVGPHVVIKGPTTIGENNKIFQFSSVGEDCQDLKYKGEPTRLEMGDGNVIREYVSIHRGTTQDQGLTKIGNQNLFVTYSHVAHDCVIGDNAIIGHHVGLAGHVHVGDYAILSGFAAVHQFCHIGAHCFLGHLTMLVKDLPPYIMAVGGDNPKAVSINSEGLKRRGFDPDTIMALKRAYKVLYRQGLTVEQALVELKKMATTCEAIQPLLSFVEQSSRGILR